MNKLLLDTHTFLWMDLESNQLLSRAKSLLQERSNRLLVSVVSIWEIVIKLQLGKLKLQYSLTELIESQKQINHIDILPITLDHVLALPKLPNHHKDPFDRLLIAQAIVEQAALISNDALLAKYSVEVIW
ncbi:PilT protein-like protein [Thioploca ingrica]|uniref:PilT protein-like protein n=1 Tax=Thioploca ingrica TaxID=40754 RepID=A0A090AD86_9GAMM|nr:PilT protein-like protein [Thioploca ingrica]